jgi:hypothetical protein
MGFILNYLFFYFCLGIIFSGSAFLILFSLNKEKLLNFNEYIIILCFYPFMLNYLINGEDTESTNRKDFN